ncbi:aminoglycoside phosphotransferase family protein [Chryseomicrobium sp. FSL W7-1435]|uniref:aminoglycoside phosphotransferase family protein n=1 Tax=Chryseomicrobium sp. FSL W7-1435 TaxID=2921704 RepID=UPI00315A5B53
MTAFEENVLAAFGERGETWLVNLPQHVLKIAATEQLNTLVPFSNLSYHYVVRAVQNEKSVVLKVGLPGADFTNELLALQAFANKSVVKVFTVVLDEGYYIMENIVPGESLYAKFPDTRTNVRIFVEQWRRLHSTAKSSIVLAKLPGISSWFETLNYSGDIPEAWLLEARRAQQRLADSNEDVILHGDLHHENIVWDVSRGFVVIDPKGVIGHAYYDCVQFLFNKNATIEEFKLKLQLLISTHGFDADKLLDAVKALGTVYLLWSLEEQSKEAQQRYDQLEWLMNHQKEET